MEGKKVLDIFPYGNVMSAHGASSDNLGCVQCGSGAAAAGNPELSCAARTACGGDRGFAGAGAAVGFETPARFARGGTCQRTPRRPPEVLSDQRRSDPPASRV